MIFFFSKPNKKVRPQPNFLLVKYKKLGINPSTVSKYMRLDKYPSLDTFANICQILDISADDILGLK